MAFDVQVVPVASGASVQRVVPIRFARAVTGGFSDIDAPDLDDRGFVPRNPHGQAHGPAVGIRRNQTIRVRVMRDMIDPAAQLFVTSEDPSIVEVEHPASGSALNTADIAEVPANPGDPTATPPVPATAATPARPADCIFLKGVSTSGNTAETMVKVRFGSETGPVLGELAVLVYPVLVIRVQAHRVSINGTAAAVTLDQVRSLFRRVNRIYAQAGITFSVQGTLLNETVTGFATAGFVTLPNFNDAGNTELQTVLNQNPDARSLNAYFIPGYRDTTTTPPSINQTLGIAFSRDSANANPPSGTFPGCQAGITMIFQGSMNTLAHTCAHEIGHALRLEHYNNKNPPGAGDSHIWGRRCLMHNFVGVSGFNIGYGPNDFGNSAGQLLSTKKVPRIFQSDQVNTVRRAMLNNSYRPVARP